MPCGIQARSVLRDAAIDSLPQWLERAVFQTIRVLNLLILRAKKARKDSPTTLAHGFSDQGSDLERTGGPLRVRGARRCRVLKIRPDGGF